MSCFVWDAYGTSAEFLPVHREFYCLILLYGDKWVDEVGVILSGVSNTFAILGFCASLNLHMSSVCTLDPPYGIRYVASSSFGGCSFEFTWSLSVLPSSSAMILQ